MSCPHIEKHSVHENHFMCIWLQELCAHGLDWYHIGQVDVEQSAFTTPASRPAGTRMTDECATSQKQPWFKAQELAARPASPLFCCPLPSTSWEVLPVTEPMTFCTEQQTEDVNVVTPYKAFSVKYSCQMRPAGKHKACSV